MTADPRDAPHGWLGRRALVFGMGAGWPALGAAAAPGVIEAVYPRMPERPVEAYPFRLLKLALEASGRAHRLRLTEGSLPSMRAFKELRGANST